MDARDEVRYVLPLVEINTSDGRAHRFILGTDGEFTDTTGRKWLGSTLLSGAANQMLIGDIAPRGSINITFIQDPSMDDTVAQMKALGVNYVYGLPIRFYSQPLESLEQVGNPTLPPRLIMTREQTGLTFNMEGPATRGITLTYEGIGANGNMQLRRVYNTTDHARLIGRQNPSLQYMPKEIANDVALIG